MGSRIQDYIRGILVSWLDFRVLKAFCQQFDLFVDDAVTAHNEAFLETQSGQMLDYTARNSDDRRIQYRFPLPETDAQLRAYLCTRWARHAEAGVLDALDFQTRRYGFSRYTWVDELSLREAGYALPFGQPPDGLIGGSPYSPTSPTVTEFTAPDGTPVTSYKMWPLAGDPLPGGGTALTDHEPGPGTGFFAVIIHPPHYFTNGFLWDDGSTWDSNIEWDLGPVNGYPGVRAGAIIQDYATLIRDWRPAGSSLRHVVVDFVGDCVIDDNTSTGYSGSDFVVIPTHEPGEKLPDGTYGNLYNTSWKIP